MSKGRPEKERKEGQKLFGKKKELPSLLLKRSKSNHDHEKNSTAKERKKAVGCPTKESDSLTP